MRGAYHESLGLLSQFHLPPRRPCRNPPRRSSSSIVREASDRVKGWISRTLCPQGHRAALLKARYSAVRVRLGHGAEVERLVERRVVHAGLAGDLAEGAAGLRRLLHDLAGLVVADVRVERRGRRERQLGVALAVL